MKMAEGNDDEVHGALRVLTGTAGSEAKGRI